MPGYFLIGVYSACRHFYECHILTQWGHWGLNFWLQFIFTLHLRVTEMYLPSKLFCDGWVLSSLSTIIWDVAWIHGHDKFSNIFLNLEYTVLMDKYALFPCFMDLPFHTDFMYKPVCIPVQPLKLEDISVQSLEGPNQSGSNRFSFQDWLL